MKRIVSIDVLRGLMALAVMAYHFVSWSVDSLDSNSILSRFGLYAVPIFYLVSGYSLAYVYWFKPTNIRNYLLARLWRILPLFYLVSAIFFLYTINEGFDLFTFLLNFSLLFSILDPTSYYATGAWSIGNEIFFYLVFAIILIGKKRELLLTSFLGLSLVLFLYFRCFLLVDSQSLSEQWATYIHPFNHLVYFLVGVALFRLNVIANPNPYLIGLAIITGILIFVIDNTGDRINLAVNSMGIMLSLSCVSIFILVVFLDKLTPYNFLTKELGDLSYSIYLMHPIVWAVSKRSPLPSIFSGYDIAYMSVVSLITVLCCHITYHYFEKPILRYGKSRMTSSNEKVKEKKEC